MNTLQSFNVESNDKRLKNVPSFASQNKNREYIMDTVRPLDMVNSGLISSRDFNQNMKASYTTELGVQTVLANQEGQKSTKGFE